MEVAMDRREQEMSQLLERDRTGPRVAPGARKRVPVLEYALLLGGALLTLLGVYVYYAPTDWVLGDLAEGWYLGSFIVGGLTLSGGFVLFADRMGPAHGGRSWLVTAGILLASAAFAAAVLSAATLFV
jgi:hypothetical protein